MLFLLLCRRVAVAGLHCLLPSASNVLPSTFNLSGEVTSVSAARCLLMYCQVPSICLGESLLWFCSSKALILSAKFYRVLLFFGLNSVLILLLCRRVAVAGLHCLLPSASNVLPSTFNLSGEVTSLFAAEYLQSV